MKSFLGCKPKGARIKLVSNMICFRQAAMSKQYKCRNILKKEMSSPYYLDIEASSVWTQDINALWTPQWWSLNTRTHRNFTQFKMEKKYLGSVSWSRFGSLRIFNRKPRLSKETMKFISNSQSNKIIQIIFIIGGKITL